VPHRSSDGDISERVRQFVFDHIDSVEQIEVLLFLRTHTERGWTAEELSREFRSSETSINSRLKNLVALGILKEAGTNPLQYQYAPSVPATDELLKDVAETYAIKRQKLQALIFSPLKRARQFADAFNISRSNKPTGEDDNG
jgi:predicted transcriptional regulator